MGKKYTVSGSLQVYVIGDIEFEDSGEISVRDQAAQILMGEWKRVETETDVIALNINEVE